MTSSSFREHVERLEAFLGNADVVESLAAAEVNGAISESLYSELGRHRLFALSVGQAYDGLEMPLTERLMVHKLVAEQSASLQSVLTVHEMVVYAIQRFGRAGTREKWLPRLASGACVGAFALTEPKGGSDFAQIELSAKPHLDGFALNGVKSWVSSGLRAGVVLAFANLEGLPNAFLVDRESPGLYFTRAPTLNAFKAASLATLRFEDCVVAADSQIGPGHLVPRVAIACLTLGRILVSIGALAIGSAALDLMIERAKQRVVGRDVLASSPLVQDSVADSYLRLRAGCALTVAAAAAVDARRPEATRQAIVAKLSATKAAANATSNASRLHGASGFVADSTLVRYLAESLVYAAIEGGEEALGTALGSDILRSGNDLWATLDGIKRC